MSVHLVMRVVKDTHTDIQTHDVKIITPVADAGCNDWTGDLHFIKSHGEGQKLYTSRVVPPRVDNVF